MHMEGPPRSRSMYQGAAASSARDRVQVRLTTLRRHLGHCSGAVARLACGPPTSHGSLRPTKCASETSSDLELLFPDERQTVEIFDKTKSRVVFVTVLSDQHMQDPVTMDLTKIPSGSGSGFVWDAEGHIVTNAHVALSGSGGFIVVFEDQQQHECELVGLDEEEDLAVLKIKYPPHDLKPLVVQQEKMLHVGQRVMAIGNPFGLDLTLTTGVVSGLGRELPVDPERGIVLRDLIQFDASINPGNSGGPLLNSRGQVIGVNTAIVSPQGGGSVGIGFAIPIARAKSICDELIEYGRIRRPQLGVAMAPNATYYRLRQRQQDLPPGVLVISVSGAAQQAGVIPCRQNYGSTVLGDIIVSFNKESIRRTEELVNAVRRCRVGVGKVPFTVFRQGKIINLVAEL